MIDRRLRTVIKQTDRQKGFTSENGCHANVHLLGEALQVAKSEGGVFGVKDVSKSFDTVPHGIIKRALMRKGIDQQVAEYIAKMYQDCTTTIKAEGPDVNILLQRGVKQGDSLSPLLFNLCIEPIIEKIQKNTKGIKVQGHNLAIMAFADDVVILGTDKEQSTQQTELLADYLDSLGMSLSLEKCNVFQYVPNGKTWYMCDPEITVRGTRIPHAPANEIIKYLGAKFSPWKGLMKGQEEKIIQEMILRTAKLPLKPMQKLELLSSYLLPRFTYGLTLNPPSSAVLRSIDTMIRTQVKKILHLSAKTSNAFLYSPRRQGGLGLVNLEKMVQIAALRNGIKALHSSDVIVRDSIKAPRALDRLKGYAEALQMPWRPSIKEIDKRKETVKNEYVREWAKQQVQGQGVREFSMRVSNAWLQNHTLLKHSRIADAIKMRTNTYPTRMCIKRFAHKSNPLFDTNCRKCSKPHETMGHILGECLSTKAKRIKRHDEIKELLAQRLGQENQVYVEHSFVANGERLRPDLVVKTNENEALIVDVTVRFEKGNYLREAAKEKVEKYKKISKEVKKTLSVRKVKVIPIVIGSRGAVLRETVSEFRRLKIKQSDQVTVSMIALRSSIEMLNSFMDYDETTDPPLL